MYDSFEYGFDDFRRGSGRDIHGNLTEPLGGAQRARVVPSYAFLAALGRLSAARRLPCAELYEPAAHLEAARDERFGWTDRSRRSGAIGTGYSGPGSSELSLQFYSLISIV
ncbi:hypothetical protein C5689_15715 [Methylosinus sporium]|uniref:Uncharacterized protein n=1 Tax=Methylosinus sporium TaxID=428 RepID=A0A2U1SMV3_METSR|nr:hypothetical protein C5689_15715 [Methylosinus sporium]